MIRFLKLLFLISLIFCIMYPAISEEDGFKFKLGMGIGANTFQENGEAVAYTGISFLPDFSYKKFGVGLDLTINTNFKVIREEDWVVDSDNNFFEVYLPKFRYIRYGEKGDPFYAKLGSIDDATLGNGFIMQNYSNMLFLPDRRIFGLALDVNGSLFNVPYIGMETFVANVITFDVLAGRFYYKPFYTKDYPIFKELQIGLTYAMDRDAYAYYEDATEDADPISIIGFDFRQPLISKELFNLAVYGDVVFENSESDGEMIGLGGRLVKIIPYDLQARFIGENFIPTYFDASYDLFRADKYAVVSGLVDTPRWTGWLFTTGISVLSDKLALLFSLDGPFSDPTDGFESYIDYPHLLGTFIIADGLIPNFSFNAIYDKKFIKEFNDIFDPYNAYIAAKLNYTMGNAVISLIYTLRYNPDPAPGEENWEVTTGFQTAISF